MAAIEVETKDCTALTDAELAEMGDVCGEQPMPYDIGLLSKQRDEWVLVTQARLGAKLHGFSFCTLERIGGTPSVVIGVASIRRTSRRDSVLRAIVGEQFRRAVLAFPDEDVLVAARFGDPSAFEAFRSLSEVVPRPDATSTGEERAWGRRLVKRFGEEGAYDERSFLLQGDGNLACVLDHESLKPEALDPALVKLFKGLNPAKGDAVIAFGWALAEDLEKLAE